MTAGGKCVISQMTAKMLSRLIFPSMSPFKNILKHVWKVAMPRFVLVQPNAMSDLPAAASLVLTITARYIQRMGPCTI